MKILVVPALVLCATWVVAAEPPPAASRQPAAENAIPSTGEAGVAPTKDALKQAFDGAMTCSAVCALEAREAGADTAWLWHNRSFAFGMLAVQFYTQATEDKVSREDMDGMLTEYANSLQTMSPKEREPFDEGCARKFAQIDQLCTESGCPHAPPAAPAFTPPVGAPAQ